MADRPPGIPPRPRRRVTTLCTERLRCEPLAPRHIDAFHALCIGAHVRRSLMDGQVLSRAWCAEKIAESEALFETRGIGLWLAYRSDIEGPDAQPVRFGGFLVLPDHFPEPRLVYALPERHTGRGYATELARGAVAEARRHAGFETIHASVDALNTRSMRVLERLGFERTGERPDAFGHEAVLCLDPALR